jgi:hypothetical protein
MAESTPARKQRFVVAPEISQDGWVRILDTDLADPATILGEPVAHFLPEYADIAYDTAERLSMRALIKYGPDLVRELGLTPAPPSVRAEVFAAFDAAKS